MLASRCLPLHKTPSSSTLHQHFLMHQQQRQTRDAHHHHPCEKPLQLAWPAFGLCYRLHSKFMASPEANEFASGVLGSVPVARISSERKRGKSLPLHLSLHHTTEKVSNFISPAGLYAKTTTTRPRYGHSRLPLLLVGYIAWLMWSPRCEIKASVSPLFSTFILNHTFCEFRAESDEHKL